MPKKESTVLYRWFDEVWNKGNEKAIYEMLDENAITHGITGDVSRGPEAFKFFMTGFVQNFQRSILILKRLFRKMTLKLSGAMLTLQIRTEQRLASRVCAWQRHVTEKY